MKLFNGKSPAMLSKFILFFITCSVILLGCSPAPETDQKDKTIVQDQTYFHNANIATFEPEHQYSYFQNYIGKIVTKQLTTLSFEYSGNIDSIYVDSGETVKKGQVLAEQNTELLLIQLKGLKAKIVQQQAKLTLNKANLKRIKTLISKSFSAQQTLDELNAEQQILTASIEELHSRLQSYKYQFNKTKLIAPFNGVISRRMVAEGENSSAGMPILLLLKNHHQEITLGVPAKLANTLKIGQEFSASFTLQGSEQIAKPTIQVKLIAIGQQIDAINRTIELRFKLLNSPSKFNGQLINVRIKKTISQQGFWLPLSALIDGVRGQWNVYLAEKVTVDSSQLSNKTIFIIKSTIVNLVHTTQEQAFVTGLDAKKQHIIVEGVHRFVPGQKILKNTLQHKSPNKSITTEISTKSNTKYKTKASTEVNRKADKS